MQPGILIAFILVGTGLVTIYLLKVKLIQQIERRKDDPQQFISWGLFLGSTLELLSCVTVIGMCSFYLVTGQQRPTFEIMAPLILISACLVVNIYLYIKQIKILIYTNKRFNKPTG